MIDPQGLFNDEAQPATEPVGAGDEGVSMPAVLDPEQQSADDAKKRQDEEKVVAGIVDEYNEAYEFDKGFRQGVAIDRRYAAGTADMNWAVSTNLIGSFIDVLQSILYARDPDVSVTKAEQVDNEGTAKMDDFAKTLELVISYLWRKANLKRSAKKLVRSALSVSEGWLKVIMVCDKVPIPQVEADLQDARAQIARLEAVAMQLKETGNSDEQTQQLLAEQKLLEATLQAKIEASVKKYLALDVIPAQNFQCSLDVRSTEDHLDADWNANYIVVPLKTAKTRFPRLTEADWSAAKRYYQKQTSIKRDEGGHEQLTALNNITAEDAELYTATNPGDKSPAFVKVIELWDKRDLHIKTWIDGTKIWAVEPYTEPYASSRFYCYFRLAFFEVDDQRHPQSLSGRLSKLQDEYSTSRSNFRLTRERSIPGVLFNSSQMTPDGITKVKESKHAEFTPCDLPEPNTQMASVFMAKPIPSIDVRLFDNQPILQDMERVSGVQEALQGAITTTKTATEANIQQSGAMARTNADRDMLESMLTDLANYTAEQALGALKLIDVQKIAGPAAFWPEGIDVNDLVSMADVTIEAGSTGKPRNQGDREAWGVILPLLQQMQVDIQQARSSDNEPLAKSVVALLQETMRRMGDESDPDRFIPSGPAPAPPTPPVVPKVNISLAGEVPPQLAAAIAAPVVAQDQAAAQPSPSPTIGGDNPLASLSGASPQSPPMAGAGSPAGMPASTPPGV